MERVYPIPSDAKHYHLFTHDSEIKQHPSYAKAKSGDPEAALAVIDDLAFEFLKDLKGKFPAGTVFVSPFAKEAKGDNALPLILSLMCARILDGESETDIVQLQRVFHTGADPMERMRLRPSFEGMVRSDTDYVLVDDVSNMGGTLAELANYILLNGGGFLVQSCWLTPGDRKSFSL